MDKTGAVVFDMDGVLLDSMGIWKQVITDLIPGSRGLPSSIGPRTLEGDKSEQWASFLRQAAKLPLDEKDIIAYVVDSILAAYEKDLPLLPGAEEAMTRLAAFYPLAVASSSPRPIIAFVLERSGLGELLTTWVSSDEVPCGKPAPDVYLEASRRLGILPKHCVAVEDSVFGVQAAKAAGMKIIAVPAPSEVLEANVVDMADRTLESIDLLCPDVVAEILCEQK